jgi:ABC-type transport system involved in multi-copper enzyme maturation permease subunit
MYKILVLAGGVLKEIVRRKDLYLIFMLLLVIVFYASFISFGGETGFLRYFKEIVISLAYIFSVIIAATFASRQIPQETEAKTIYPLLAHPLSRGQFILGKFAGVVFVSAASFSLFYLVFVIALVLRHDFSTPALLLVEGYFLHLFLLTFFVALTLLLSLFLSPAANTVLILIFYFATNWFGATFPDYVLLPHPELFDIKEKIIHTQDIVPLWAVLFLAAYAVIYASIFLTAANAAFRRRNL